MPGLVLSNVYNNQTVTMNSILPLLYRDTYCVMFIVITNRLSDLTSSSG